MRVDLFLQPTSLSAWPMSEWLNDVAPHRRLALRVRTIGGTPASAGGDSPAGAGSAASAGLACQSRRIARVVEAMHWCNEDGACRFYQTWRTGDLTADTTDASLSMSLVAALAKAGLPKAYAAAADDTKLDIRIEQSMAAKSAMAGAGAVDPTVILHAKPAVCLVGPMVSSALTVRQGLDLWDKLFALAVAVEIVQINRLLPAEQPFWHPGIGRRGTTRLRTRPGDWRPGLGRRRP
jgi:hypothetical protein